MASDEDQMRWQQYFAATEGKAAHAIFDTLEKHLPDSGDAIDLGCGTGSGTERLLARGLRVTATDVAEEALRITRERAPAGAPLTLVHAPFQELRLEPNTYDVACAVFTLFFLTPPEFEVFWPTVVASLRPGGIFAGQFLGERDTWRDRGYTVHARAEVDRLLEGFEVLHMQEVEEDGPTAIGETKHWHVFHVIARKRG